MDRNLSLLHKLSNLPYMCKIIIVYLLREITLKFEYFEWKVYSICDIWMDTLIPFISKEKSSKQKKNKNPFFYFN